MPRIVFLHPDLGIGGAERLVVDAALSLKQCGHEVKIVTTYHDKNRAFDETVNGVIPVMVIGNWIPRSFFGKCYALMAYIRMIYAAFYIILMGGPVPDIAFCDLVSVAVPILKLRIPNTIFYCHYPDQLLSSPNGLLKSLYRLPLNWLEEVSTGKATHIFVNSKFTAEVFKNTFVKLKCTPDILYPSLNMNFFDSCKDELPLNFFDDKLKDHTFCFLSINRYERKKNVKLALEAFSVLQKLVGTKWDKVHLIVAGGYDSRVTENLEYFEELTQLKYQLNIDSKVTFLKSISDNEKLSLLKASKCLLYTPSNEHFGIVPIEAMYMKKPVIAANSGGPMETIAHNVTGYLCDSTPNSFGEAMSRFVLNEHLLDEMGAAGRKRVVALFSFKEFSTKLNDTVYNLLDKKCS